MSRASDPTTVDVCPEAEGKWSVCLMDADGEVLDAVAGMSLESAIGTASKWASERGIKYRVVNTPADPASN